MAVRIYSTQERAKTVFEPQTEGRVSMYVCGPTVYDSCHIGHARPAVVFDTIRRYLEYSGFVVTFISNITDIDDKIINRSRELGISWRDLARRYQDEYEQDMAALGVLSPSIRPRATEHIPEMIALIQGLVDKGVAYVTPKGVWFDVAKFPAYGQLSGRSKDDENTEHRVEQDAEKHNQQDFALWKSVKPGEPHWDSPWGPGRPGWHIECSAMSGKYCDFQLDIHGGGADLAFPHHENEKAQSEAFTNKQFVRYWLHNGFITVGKSDGTDDEGVKMGKSKGNAFWLRDAFRVASPAALRLWILGTHYRMPILYKPELLTHADNALSRVYNCLEEAARVLDKAPDAVPGNGAIADAVAGITVRFREAMDDDFNTPQALAAVYEAVNAINQGVREQAPAAELKTARNLLFGMLGVLGLPLERRSAGSSGDVNGLMELLLAIRADARKDRNFALSDQIRDGLNHLGIEINDRGGESTWTKK